MCDEEDPCESQSLSSIPRSCLEVLVPRRNHVDNLVDVAEHGGTRRVVRPPILLVVSEESVVGRADCNFLVIVPSVIIHIFRGRRLGSTSYSWSHQTILSGRVVAIHHLGAPCREGSLSMAFLFIIVEPPVWGRFIVDDVLTGSHYVGWKVLRCMMLCSVVFSEN